MTITINIALAGHHRQLPDAVLQVTNCKRRNIVEFMPILPYPAQKLGPYFWCWDLRPPKLEVLKSQVHRLAYTWYFQSKHTSAHARTYEGNNNKKRMDGPRMRWKVASPVTFLALSVVSQAVRFTMSSHVVSRQEMKEKGITLNFVTRRILNVGTSGCGASCR